MRHSAKVSGILAAAVLSCGLSVGVNADSIGVNFVGGGGPNTGSSLAPTDVAGLVPQGNFNNASGGSGSLTGLTDQNGNITTAGAAWTSPNTWSSGTDTSTPNGKLLNGYIDSNGSAAGGAMVTLTNIPYSAYDLIVYFNTDNGTPRAGDYEVVTSAGTQTQQALYEKSSSIILAPPDLSNTLATTAATPGGTFIIFPGLTDSSIKLESNQASLPGVNFRAPISGFQIYSATPEPGSLGLLTAIGGMALTRRRKVAAT
jgi:hypothetical protein